MKAKLKNEHIYNVINFFVAFVCVFRYIYKDCSISVIEHMWI